MKSNDKKGTDKSAKATDKVKDTKAKSTPLPTGGAATKEKPTAKGANGYGPTAAGTSSRNTSSYGSGAENANGGGYES